MNLLAQIQSDNIVECPLGGGFIRQNKNQWFFIEVCVNKKGQKWRLHPGNCRTRKLIGTGYL
jgi:hypothetical protein